MIVFSYFSFIFAAHLATRAKLCYKCLNILSTSRAAASNLYVIFGYIKGGCNICRFRLYLAIKSLQLFGILISLEFCIGISSLCILDDCVPDEYLSTGDIWIGVVTR